MQHYTCIYEPSNLQQSHEKNLLYHVVEIFPPFCGNEMFITGFKKANKLYPPSARPIDFISSHSNLNIRLKILLPPTSISS